MLYNRLLPVLEKHQSFDQFGFRPQIRLEDALLVVETVISKCNEFQIPLYLASLDLKKAFDRIEFSVLFDALRSQEVRRPELALLLNLYSKQVGHVKGNKSFQFLRGVKQGDVLSSLLFNAAIEYVFGKWK